MLFSDMKIGSYEQAIENMKRDISMEFRLKTRVKSIERIMINSQQQIVTAC
jgi:hypothetical protein